VALGVVLALVSALCYGVAAVLQALAARKTTRLVGVVAQVPFLVGGALDVLGFGSQFLALRSLPVFVVQAAQASGLAVTALVAIPVLGSRLTGRQWAAVGAVAAGLAAVSVTAVPAAAESVTLKVRVLLAACVIVLAVAGLAASRVRGKQRGTTLGLVAGLGFGVVALCARALELRTFWSDPAAYGLVGAGIVAFVFYTSALQRGNVTTTVAAIVVAETLLPAIVGVLVLGDRIRPGLLPVAAGAFALVVAGAVVLARTQNEGDLGSGP
jgi:drug/metabolite transporter (DMT)-like permease